ncbi:unnamed protein product, partial [Durusdinium trenchii]
MATRPPWDGRVYDASLLNTRQPAYAKTYFSNPEKLKEPIHFVPRPRATHLQPRRGTRNLIETRDGRCPCCGQMSVSTRASSEWSELSGIPRWTNKTGTSADEMSVRCQGPEAKSLAADFDAAAEGRAAPEAPAK